MSRRKQNHHPQENPGTKSLSFAARPSADPEAPFGRDENDKVLVPMRPDQAIATELRERPDLAPGKCRHKNDPSNCLLCGTKPILPRKTDANQSPSRQRELRHIGDVLTPEEAKAEHREVLEENARRMFKTPKPTIRHAHAAAFDALFDKKKPPVAPAPKKPSSLSFDCYRELLMMERNTIIQCPRSIRSRNA